MFIHIGFGAKGLQEGNLHGTPGRPGALLFTDTQGSIVSRREIETGFPGMKNGDKTSVIESSGGTPPIKVLDQFGDDFF